MRHNPYHAIHRNPYHYASPSHLSPAEAAAYQARQQAAAIKIPPTAPSNNPAPKGKGLYALVPLAAAGIMYIRSESLLKAFGVTFISPMYLAYIGLKKLSGKKVLEKQK
jgi:hypothetical protein